MAGAQLGEALRQIQWLFADGSTTGLSDTQLLSRFAARRDETAFEALLARHGPMVLTVCRAVLRDPFDAEDAFQATFLVLARKAGSSWTEGQLGGWLHKVAYRIAVRASADLSRRRAHERRVALAAVIEYTPVASDDAVWPALHDEIARLPDKFRIPIVLCYLEGLTQPQAAAHLRCGEATLRRRLAGARERLRLRLALRGFAPIAAAQAASLARQARTAVPGLCARRTTRAVLRVAAGEAMATVVSARVVRLTQGGLSMITNGSKYTAFTLLSFVAVATLAGVVGAGDDKTAAQTADRVPPSKATVVQPEPAVIDPPLKPTAATNISEIKAGKEWPMTLAHAFRIAMENSKAVRVLAVSADGIPIGGFDPRTGGPANDDRQPNSPALVIGRLDAAASPWLFKSELMAHCRSVEQRYWNLAAAHAQMASSRQAVAMGQEILDRAQAELKKGRGTLADVAEASQRLEQFHLDLTSRTSDVVTTECALRNVLGLPAADNRRIIPMSKPTAELVDPDWVTCLTEMKREQPDIVVNTLAVTELAEPTSFEPGRTIRALSSVEQERKESQRKDRQEKLRQVLHLQTHALARSFLEVDANYKQIMTATRMRTSATARLDAQRAFYNEGRITIDRLLDAVSQYVTAAATEFQYKTHYNIALTHLSEAKGTLLADREIAVVDQTEGFRKKITNENNVRKIEVSIESRTPGEPAPISPAAGGASARFVTTPDPIPSAYSVPDPLQAPETKPTVGPIMPGPTNSTAGNGKRSADDSHAPRAWKFSFSIGGERPFVIKGTVSESTADRPEASGH
jgi:RNA polymerase sigma factor (sigma-70 family)